MSLRYSKMTFMRRMSWLEGLLCNGLFTFTDPDSDFDSDSDPIPVLRNWDWTPNLTLCSVKSSAYY